MSEIKLINRNNNPIEISFSIRQKDQSSNDLLLDIIANVGQIESAYHNITIDYDSVDLLMKKINDFVDGSCDKIQYSPLQEDFHLYVLKNKFTKEEMLAQMKNAGVSELSIKQIEEHPETFALIFMIDNSKYERDIVTNTGIAYWIKVTKNDLAAFSEELKVQFNLIRYS